MEVNNNLVNDEIKKFQNASQNQQLEKLSEMRQELQTSLKEKEDKEDPDNILYKNIDRANKFLDILEKEILLKDEDDEGNRKEKKNLSRLFEVSAQLINAITTATTSIAGSYKDELEYEYKLQVLEIKNKELAIKEAIQGDGKGNKTTNNLIVTDRESILDIFNKNKEYIPEKK